MGPRIAAQPRFDFCPRQHPGRFQRRSLGSGSPWPCLCNLPAQGHEAMGGHTIRASLLSYYPGPNDGNVSLLMHLYVFICVCLYTLCYSISNPTLLFTYVFYFYLSLLFYVFYYYYYFFKLRLLKASCPWRRGFSD